jgi:DNA polymerase-3 subunit beta
MRITISRTHALDRFSRVAPVANGRMREILRNLRVHATESECTVEATDTELFVAVKLDASECTIEKAGTALLPRDRVLPFLRECTDSEVMIETRMNSVHLRCGKATINVPSENPEEFPAMQYDEPKSVVVLDGQSFGAMIQRTAFCTDSDSTRYALGGVLLFTEHGELLAVGTDGRRLSHYRDVCEGTLDASASVIVPATALKFLSRDFSDGDVKVWSTPSNFYFEDGTTRLAARLIEGRFPKWESVIPDVTNYQQITITNPELLQSAVKQASIVSAGADSRAMKITISDGTLRMECKEPDSGESRVELPIEYAGETIVKSLDYRFLGEFLKLLAHDDHLLMYASDGGSPVLFETGLHKYVLMPMAKT